MSVYVQFPERPGVRTAGADYRRGFLSHVRSRLAADDTVVLIEPNPTRARELRALWQDVPQAVVLEQEACLDPACPGVVDVLVAGDPAEPVAVTRDHQLGARFAPSGPVAVQTMRCTSLSGIRNAHGPIELVGVDARVTDVLAQGLAEAHAVSVVTIGLSDDVATAMRRTLASLGYRTAGRLHGEAGSSEAFLRTRTPDERRQAAMAQMRTKVGAAVVAVRDATPRGERADALRDRTRSLVDPRFRSRDLLDTRLGCALTPIDDSEVDVAVAGVLSDPTRRWTIPAFPDDVEATARACHDRFGVWPISFSYPAGAAVWTEQDLLISPITPGYPYSFDDAAAYLREYGRAHLAITHRKAGWDCFRHLEILASGSVPLMPDAAEIPPFSMVHYPKAALAAVATQARSGGAPDEATRRQFRHWFERHLTTRAMAEYLLGASGHAHADRILFVDERLPFDPEYLSTLTLVGLKEVLGGRVDVAFPGPHLYTDFPGSVADFYGRGFGYLKAVDPSARTAAEAEGVMRHGLDHLDDYDCIVIGSVSRNMALTEQVLRHAPADRVILVHGEDGAPSLEEARLMRASGAHTFVRAIHRSA